MSLTDLKRAVVLAPDDAQARYALAEEFFSQGQFASAEKQAGKALELNPEHPNAARLLARAQGALGQRPDTADPSQWLTAARRYVEQGRYDDAILYGEAALRRDPDDLPGWVELAQWCHRQRLEHRALLAYGRALQKTQYEKRIVEARDHLLAGLGEDDGLELLSDAPTAFLEVAEALVDGDLQTARRTLATLDVGGKDAAFIDRFKAEIFLAEGDAVKAKAALERAQKKDDRPYTPGRLAKRLQTKVPGRIGVLGWTPVGGAVSPMEAVAVIGGSTLQFTGNVGETGREAGLVAYSCLKALSVELGIDGLVANFNLHLHFTDIEFGKEGMSSGLALTLAGLSAFRKKPLFHRLGATGAITLRGEVQRVDGIYEKAVAAKHAGLRRVLHPRGNTADVKALPKLVTDCIEFIPVSDLNEAIAAAFVADTGK